MLIRNFKKWLGERLFPVFCLGCGEEGGWLCRACLSRPVMLGNPMHEKVPYIEGVFSLFPYREELIAKLIKKLKYDGASDVMEVFNFYLEKFLANHSLPVSVIVPVPLHRQRLVERGFNQSELIARSLARLSGLPFEDKLKRVKKTSPQVGLSGEAREKNLADAFAVKDELKDVVVILVDDVLTTGSTLKQAAKVCHAAGAAQVWGFTLAREF